MRETTQDAPGSLNVNHAARSIRCAPVWVLLFSLCPVLGALFSNGGGY